MVVWPYDQNVNVQEMVGKASSAGYTHGKAAQRLTKD